ncbi:hypothetical protein M9H77_04930 [Catharanthus roseus]|uniref:Uncharacterized protein n=1 Tax=Catharanthus roseus TaxID=4058 RepID=A0ACC0CFS0_CATRO|nr:hypothetical protein M9H77_04930 [Catharanthus roseus]
MGICDNFFFLCKKEWQRVESQSSLSRGPWISLSTGLKTGIRWSKKFKPNLSMSFLTDRECDPDVCRNCLIRCDDDTRGSPSQRGKDKECMNMELLHKKQQKVLLESSNLYGWVAILKYSVAMHEYLGEYTSELILHRKADKCCKIYDSENSSFFP